MAIEVKNEILIVEDIQIEMETLRIASSVLEHQLLKFNALMDIRDIVIAALSSDDREKLETYIRGGHKVKAEDYENRENPCEDER